MAIGLWCALLPSVCLAAPTQLSSSWLRTPANFAHAMGGLTVTRSDGSSVVYTYTNTLEAFNQNYAKGYRIFEVDLTLSSDGYLVARHDWSPSLFRALGQSVPSKVPTRSQFLKAKVLKYYTPLDISGIVALMRSHPDMYVITDTKSSSSWYVSHEFKRLVSALGPDKATLSNRFIVQIYDEPMLKKVRAVYHFPNWIYTFYHLPAGTAVASRAVRFAKANGIHVVTFDMTRWSPGFIRQVRAAGIAPAINTINSAKTAEMLNGEGVRFLYTDALGPHPDAASADASDAVRFAPTAVPFNRKND